MPWLEQMLFLPTVFFYFYASTPKCVEREQVWAGTNIFPKQGFIVPMTKGGEKDRFSQAVKWPNIKWVPGKGVRTGKTRNIFRLCFQVTLQTFLAFVCPPSGLAITRSQYPRRIPLPVVGFQPLLPRSFQIHLELSVRYWVMGNDFKMFRAPDTKTINHGNSAHCLICLVASPQKSSIRAGINVPSFSFWEPAASHLFLADWFLFFYP